VHQLQASYQPYRHDKRAIEPVAPGDLAQCQPPDWMNDQQRAIWRDLLARAPIGILHAIDLELFAAYVELVDCYQMAVRTQNELRILDAQGALSPYRRVIKDCFSQMVRLQSEMGFTPAARTRLGQPAEPPSQQPAAEDPWSQLRRVPKAA
jgi:P27 family predicted phage terminase small subunit